MSVKRLSPQDTKYMLKINGALDLDLELAFDIAEVVSPVWVTPLSSDKSTYFACMKKPALQLVGGYKYQGKRQECTKGDCLMMMDFGRTQSIYGVSYFWVMLMVKLPDGKIVTINFCDGMSKY